MRSLYLLLALAMFSCDTNTGSNQQNDSIDHSADTTREIESISSDSITNSDTEESSDKEPESVINPDEIQWTMGWQEYNKDAVLLSGTYQDFSTERVIELENIRKLSILDFSKDFYSISSETEGYCDMARLVKAQIDNKEVILFGKNAFEFEYSFENLPVKGQSNKNINLYIASGFTRPVEDEDGLSSCFFNKAFIVNDGAEFYTINPPTNYPDYIFDYLVLESSEGGQEKYGSMNYESDTIIINVDANTQDTAGQYQYLLFYNDENNAWNSMQKGRFLK